MFPNEIWSIIFSFITDPPDVLSIKLVCNEFKDLVENEFNHSYKKNLLFWHCFKKGYFQECARLVKDPKVLSTIMGDFLPRCSEILEFYNLEYILGHLKFIDEEIYPILIGLNPLPPPNTFEYIIRKFGRNFCLVEWALDHKDFPPQLYSGIITNYLPIEHDIIFYYILNKILLIRSIFLKVSILVKQ